ncbi:MAG: hypothetical protein JKY09_00275 [Crocinitomicaceae bacterium]|nr:hypothetical protein [Crocinitomicaceae bacterium]
MKKAVLFIVMLVAVLAVTACKKDQTSSYTGVLATVHAIKNGTVDYSMDLDDDGEQDIRFEVGYYIAGNTEKSRYIKVVGLNNAEIASIEKEDPTYYNCQDTSQFYVKINALAGGDIISNDLEFTDNTVLITYRIASSQECADPILLTDLTCKTFYIGVKLKSPFNYAWVKVRADEMSKLLIYDFGYAHGMNQLIVGQ